MLGKENATSDKKGGDRVCEGSKKFASALRRAFREREAIHVQKKHMARGESCDGKGSPPTSRHRNSSTVRSTAWLVTIIVSKEQQDAPCHHHGNASSRSQTCPYSLRPTSLFYNCHPAIYVFNLSELGDFVQDRKFLLKSLYYCCTCDRSGKGILRC